MGIRDFFKKKTESDPLVDVRLDGMKAGYMVDYDMKMWEVSAAHHYDWGDSLITREWQLKGSDETVYLSMEYDDEASWSLSRKIQLDRLGPNVRKSLMETGDPPDQIELDGVSYGLEEMAGGHFYENGQEPGREMLSWDFQDQTGRRFLSIEQWSENDFEASIGEPVEEYQFSNILPGAV